MDGMLQRKNELDEGGRKVRNACILYIPPIPTMYTFKAVCSSVELSIY